ncbi:MAG: hypothetical protein NTV80_02465 [Verrucomicrobia bacterium]|nr:hypothetical protein [Verrucomicrobiota bacterium]
MNTPPRDREEFWIRFVCAFLFFGFLAALLIVRFIDSLGIAQGLGLWTVVVLWVSVYAAKVGDQAWLDLIEAIRRW